MEGWQVAIAVALIGGLGGLGTSVVAKLLDQRSERRREQAARDLGLPASDTEERLLEIRREMIEALESQNAILEAEVAAREADALACQAKVAALQSQLDDVELANTRLRMRLAAAVAPDAIPGEAPPP